MLNQRKVSYNCTVFIFVKKGFYMIYTDSDRCEMIARYMIENGATVRSAAGVFGISKSTVHKDVTKILERQNHALYLSVKELLQTNKSERHKRGGEATRLKYIMKKKGGILPPTED